MHEKSIPTGLTLEQPLDPNAFDPRAHHLLMKSREHDWVRLGSIVDIVDTSRSPVFAPCIWTFAQHQAFGIDFSPRLGGHAFYAPVSSPVEVSALQMDLVGRAEGTGFITTCRNVLKIPHRFAARIEIDGEGLVPTIAARSACRKLVA